MSQKELSGLIPVSVFQPGQAQGTWYQQLRLNASPNMPLGGNNPINVKMQIGPNPDQNKWPNQDWPIQIVRTSIVPSSTMANGLQQFEQVAQFDFSKIGTAISSVTQQISTNGLGIFAPNNISKLSTEFQSLFSGGTNNGNNVGSASPIPPSQIVSVVNAQPTSLPSVWNVQMVNWFPWLSSRVVVLDAGYANSNSDKSQYDYIVFGTPSRNVLEVYTRSPNYDSGLTQIFDAMAQKNAYPANAAQRMFIVQHSS